VLALRDATDRKAAEAELLAAFEQMESMAQTDGLTGLANRRRFDEMLSREYRRAMREASSLGVVLVDADRFKLFNDRYGHAAGDDCLRQVAVAVANAARRPGDLAARYGGEEFVLLLPNTDLAGATEVAERLRQDVLAAGLAHAGNPPLGLVSVSLGVASLAPNPDSAIDTDALLRQADTALYAAKAGGRNRVAASSLPVAA
jgi:diguanylate cyclase (GGDEF)-like protein